MEKCNGTTSHATPSTNLITPLKLPRKNLYYSAFAANALYTSLGCCLAWSSAAVPLLRSRGLTSHQETWMVSLLMLGSCLGPTIYSCSIDRFGRKYSLLLTGVIYLVSWTILGVTDDIYCLCLGRFVGGVAVGSTLNCVPVYISEISDVEMRQTLSSFTELFVSLGCLIEYAAGPSLSYGNLVLISAVPALVFGLATARVPESPYHLVARDKTQQAFETLCWLRGPSHTVTEELAQIEMSVKEAAIQTGRRMDLIKKRGPRKALLISALMFFIIPFTAIDIITSYLGPILAQTNLPISTNTAVPIIAVMEVIFGAFEPFIVHRFGSKWTLITCSSFCSLFLLSFGVYKYFDERHYNISSFSAVPIVSIILFELFFLLGVGALPWSISVELFPPSLKGFAINVGTTLHWIVDFAVVSMYGELSPVVGESMCFIFFSSVLVVGTVLQAILVPNTKGRALHAIHNDLDRS